MKLPTRGQLGAQWAKAQTEWRDPAQIASQWQEALETPPSLLAFRTRGDWWPTLASLRITLLVTREYEHLITALSVDQLGSDPEISFLRMPHPSGIAVDRPRGVVHVASTRNPNQVYDLAPATGLLRRQELGRIDRDLVDTRPLIPVRSRFFPGCLYMHDLAYVGDTLYANAVGQNAVIRLRGDGRYEPAWWPRCIEKGGRPAFDKNYIQLNSIAAGPSLAGSYFSASSDRLSTRRPGHQNFQVDKRGVIFSGRTREVIARGLTRPHSARLYRKQLWVDNSGYGEVGVVADGELTVVNRLSGWTRGLAFHRGIAFVGTSRVIPRFSRYAPGLDVETAECGVHAIDVKSGRILGSIIWPSGNQIFAIDWVPSSLTKGLPFTTNRRRSSGRERQLFYAFATESTQAKRAA